MASQLDAKFFRKAKKVNRAVEFTDSEAFIPAVKDSPEIRVKLPNRRLLTMEERTAVIDSRKEELVEVEEQIETERKALLELVKAYGLSGSGASEVVASNQKVKELMERRSKLVRPEKWIEQLEGLTFIDVFASKRDVRKIRSDVYQIKSRVEPITSLYADLTQEAAAVEPEIEAPPLEIAKPVVKTVAKPKTAEEIAKGVIIGRRTLKTVKP
jgi:hypothetical protein